MNKRVDEEKRLYPLRELSKYEVADDDPDVRGWNVISGDGKKIGEVTELIVDPSEMRVRYLDIKVVEGLEGVGDNRRLLIPVGVASIDEKEDRVYIKSIETVTLLKYPDFEGEITRDYEYQVRDSFSSDNVPAETKSYEMNDEDFYKHEHFNDENFYSSRRNRFSRLSELNITDVLGNNPDVRGWEVISSEGRKIGKVNEILVDSHEKKLRYVDIILTGTSTREYPHVLIPVGLLNADTSTRIIRLKLEEDLVKNLPVYNGSVITRDYEYSVFDSIERSDKRAERNRDIYRHENYNSTNFFPGQ